MGITIQIKIFKASIIFVLFLFSTGCVAHQRAWRYSVDSYPTGKSPILSRRVAVPPFRDSRPDRNEDALLVYLFPLVPFGWVDYSTPEAGNSKITSFPAWHFRPTQDFAMAAAEELDASGLFKEVFFTSRASEGDFVLKGEVKSTRYWGKNITYGLSLYAPGVWFLGLPMGTIHNELEVEFTLVDPLTGESLWHKSYNMTYHKSPFWIYKMPSDFDYDNLFKAMMKDVVKSLESTLSKS